MVDVSAQMERGGIDSKTVNSEVRRWGNLHDAWGSSPELKPCFALVIESFSRVALLIL